MRMQAQNLDTLCEVWPYVITVGEFVNFWRSKRIDVLEDGFRFIDPTREPDHPKLRGCEKSVRESEVQLRSLVDRRLQDMETDLNKKYSDYTIWLKVIYFISFHMLTEEKNRKTFLISKQEIKDLSD